METKRITPEKFNGGQIKFVQAGEGNIDGKFVQWGSSVKFMGLTPKPITIPLEAVSALYQRILNDGDVKEFLGVSGTY